MAPRAIWSLVAKTASRLGWVCKRSSIVPTALSLSKSASTSPTTLMSVFSMAFRIPASRWSPGTRARDARYETDTPFAVHLPLEITSCREPGFEVVCTDVGVLRLPFRYVRVEQDYGHLLARPLEDGLHEDRV